MPPNRFAALVDNRNTNNRNRSKKGYENQEKLTRVKRENKFKRSETVKKEPVIDLTEHAFPKLVITAEYDKNDETNEIKQMSYIEKIKHFKELNQKKESLPKGWVFLNKNNNFSKIGLKETNNPHYNPLNSYKIYEFRYYNRLELNDLVGDISVYSNMDNEYEYDTRELEEINDNSNSESDTEISDNDDFND